MLDEPVWLALRAAHETRVDAYVQPHLARHRAGVRHPVHDFLFSYYSERPARLRRWHPGFGVALSGPHAAAYSSWKGYETRSSTAEPGATPGG